MNIFFLDDDPKMCAISHCDKHVVKMILEYAQMMSTAHRELDTQTELIESMYKSTHKNHPSSRWVRESEGNYRWTHDLWFWLCKEYWWRYDKIHKTWENLYNKLSHVPKNIPSGVTTPPPLCMPDEYKIDTGTPVQDTIESYRKYYLEDKSSFAKWGGPVEKMRQPPEWWKVGVPNANI